MVGAVAAVLVALGVFGLGHSNGVKADVQAGNVWVLPIHSSVSASCGDAGNGGLQINTTNFPPASGGFTLATGTTTASPTGLPLIEISNVSSGSSVLNTTNPSFIDQSFIYICVNTTSGPGGVASPGVNTGTINYNTGTTNVAAANDGDLTFSAIVQSNMGFFDQPSCTNPNGGAFAEWTGDTCVNMTGNGTAQLEIPASTNNLNTVIARFNCALNPFATGLVMPITIQQDAGSFTFNVICKGEASATATTISATPNTVEIIPARSNTSHSLILLKILDSNGNPIFPGRDVDFRTDRCAIETAGLGTGVSGVSPGILGQAVNIPTLGTLNDGPTILSLGAAIGMTSALNTAAPGSFLTWEFSAVANTPVDATGAFSPQSDLGKAIDGFDLNGNGVPDNSLAGAVLSCNPVQAAGVTPGVANVSACVQVLNGLDVCVTTTVKVIGPPASITVSASPTSVNCGEKSTVTANVVDSIGQPVSDHTRVEFVTNFGGVIGGTGAVAGFAANVAPISSSVADTFGGVATSFLLTSTEHTGPYEVIATSGGTTSGDRAVTGDFPFGGPSFAVTSVNANGTPIALGSSSFGLFNPFNEFLTQSWLGGQFSTPPISAQVTVNCGVPSAAAPAAPAPAIQAPRTGTGITPPNTGDAGLASSSSSASWTLFAFAGAIAFTLAGLATVKFARR